MIPLNRCERCNLSWTMLKSSDPAEPLKPVCVCCYPPFQTEALGGGIGFYCQHPPLRHGIGFGPTSTTFEG